MSTANNNSTHSTGKIIEDLNIKFIFFRLLEYKWFILIMILLSLIGCCFYLFTLTPKYVSTALIQVDNQLGSGNNMQQLLGNMGLSTEKASPAEIEIALIKSRFILQSVVDKLKLNVSVTSNYFPLIGSIIAKHHGKDGALVPPMFGLSQYAWGGENIKVETFETDAANMDMPFTIRADGNNEFTLFNESWVKLATGKINQLIEIKLNDEVSFVKIRISKFIANKGTYFTIIRKNTDNVILDIAQNLNIIDLGEKNKAKTGVLQLSYQGSNPQILDKILNTITYFAIQRNIEKKSAEASNTLDFLNKQLPEVKNSLDQAETNLNEYRAHSGTLDISQESKIILTQLSTVEQNIANLRLRKVELLQEMTPDHPFVIVMGEKERQLQKEVDSLAKKIRSLPHSDQQAISLERTVKVKNQLYLLLLNSIQQLEVLKAGTLSDIRILSSATVPIIPLPAHSAFAVFTSLIIGLFLAIIIILIRESFQNKITNHTEVEDRINIATYAIVPYCNQQKKINSILSHRIHPLQYSVLANSSPKDVTTEAFRSLRTMLQFHFETTHNNIICLLGATSGIGKSFVSVNLAHVLTELNKKILLIDADMRKGRIHQQMGTFKNPGLSELLVGNPLDKSIYRVWNNLDFIPCGEYPARPAELLTSEKWNKLLMELSQQYDYVVIDTPPILAVTDGILLARKADTNLLVIGAGNNVMDEIELTSKRAEKNGVKIHGLIFNHLKPTKHAHINYYYAMQE